VRLVELAKPNGHVAANDDRCPPNPSLQRTLQKRCAAELQYR
jgi:hypothetical protein